jgi:hypothetical protein
MEAHETITRTLLEVLEECIVIVGAPSINAFKNRLDEAMEKYMLDLKYLGGSLVDFPNYLQS